MPGNADSRRQGRHQFLIRLTQAARHSIPSTCIVAEGDAAIPPFVQEMPAVRARRVRHIGSCHCPFLSRPAGLLRTS
jgi:hypothetical protein